jgi:hypothetical protein
LKGTITALGNNLPAIHKGETAAAYINRLKGTVTALGNNLPAIRKGESAAAYINRLNGTITADAATGAAEHDLNYAARDRTATISAHFTGGGGGFATGGAVFGRGTGTSDSIDAKLSNGEHVWTAKEVKAAGGQAAIYAMRKMALTGLLRPRIGFATGGAVTQGVTTTRLHRLLVSPLFVQARQYSKSRSFPHMTVIFYRLSQTTSA